MSGFNLLGQQGNDNQFNVKSYQRLEFALNNTAAVSNAITPVDPDNSFIIAQYNNSSNTIYNKFSVTSSLSNDGSFVNSRNLYTNSTICFIQIFELENATVNKGQVQLTGTSVNVSNLSVNRNRSMIFFNVSTTNTTTVTDVNNYFVYYDVSSSGSLAFLRSASAVPLTISYTVISF